MNKKIVCLCTTAFILLIIVVVLYSRKYKSQIYIDEENNQIKTGTSISMMLETKAGSGDYKISNSEKWPTEGYIFNSERSRCENGGTVSWDEENESIVMTSKSSDKCYVYFDVEPPDIYIATSNLSTTYGKLGSITCTNSGAVYNQQYNRVEISSIGTKYENCNLNYTDSVSKVNFASYITSLSGTTQGNGKVVNENGYRYEGKNPNNYVWFNNEYWRIIGVFDSNSHGQSGKKLVKIIRADVLDGLVWHKSTANDWTTSKLKTLLNGAYYNRTDGTNSGNCYGYSTTITANCDYRKRGIQPEYKNMIANVLWYPGGSSTESATADAFYGYERGTTITTTGYIGLMYPSDYGYSVLSSDCARTTNLGTYNTCAGKSWLYGKGNEWTLSFYSSKNGNVFFVNERGRLSYDLASYGYAVRPVLYLDATVYKANGDGSQGSPYIIGM